MPKLSSGFWTSVAAGRTTCLRFVSTEPADIFCPFSQRYEHTMFTETVYVFPLNRLWQQLGEKFRGGKLGITYGKYFP